MKISATLSRNGKWWLVYVPEVDRYTQGRSVADAEHMARDLAATMLDISINDVELTKVDLLPDEELADIRAYDEAKANDTGERIGHDELMKEFGMD